MTPHPIVCALAALLIGHLPPIYRPIGPQCLSGSEPSSVSLTTVALNSAPKPSEGTTSGAIVATKVSVKSGKWNDPQTWGGSVPARRHDCVVSLGHEVVLDESTTVRDVMVHGRLVVTNDATLQLRTLHVAVTGVYEMIEQGHLVFRNMPIIDADELSVGAIIMGEWISSGVPTTTWSKSRFTLAEGDSVVDVVEAEGWQPGDQIVIGDTRMKTIEAIDQPLHDRSFGQSHIATIVENDDGQIVFDPPLAHDAPTLPANPWGVASNAPVGLLSKSITVSSAKSDGTRGHIIVMATGGFSSSHTAFYGLGRTSPWEPVSQENRIGRYALHFHRANLRPNSVHVDHCVIHDFDKWGMSLHEVSDGVVTNNVFAGGVGAAIVTERGNELRNLIAGNLVCKITGGYQVFDRRGGAKRLTPEEREGIDLDGRADIAADGSGIWCRAVGNIITNNCIVDVAGYAININGYYREPVLPLSPAPGLPPEGEFSKTPPGVVSDNEMAGSYGGLWLTYTQGLTEQDENMVAVYNRMLAWNITRDAYASWHDGHITVNDMVIVGDRDQTPKFVGSPGPGGPVRQTRAIHFHRSYENYNVRFRNLRSYGTSIGLTSPNASFGHVRFIDCEIHAWIGAYVPNSSGKNTMTFVRTSFILDENLRPKLSPVDEPVNFFFQPPPQP